MLRFRKKKFIIIGILWGILLGILTSAIVFLLLQQLHPDAAEALHYVVYKEIPGFSDDLSTTSYSYFPIRNDVFLVYEMSDSSGKKHPKLLNLSRSYITYAGSNLEKQLKQYKLKPGDFAELSYIGYSYVGCFDSGETLTEITSCSKLSQDEALAARNYEFLRYSEAEAKYCSSRIPPIQIHQNEYADFVMVPMCEETYVYQPGTEKPLVFESAEAVMDYFSITIP